ncbi:hypothetical protein YWS52_17760 [Chitiniphilus shinanonensis]
MRVAQAAQLMPEIGRVISRFMMAFSNTVWGYIEPPGGIWQAFPVNGGAGHGAAGARHAGADHLALVAGNG